MEQNKSLKGFLTASFISLGISGLGFLSMCMAGACLLFAGSGPGDTAITNEFVLGAAGIMLFVVLAWIFAGMSSLMGIVVTIIGLAKKFFSKIWIPILSVFLGLPSFLAPFIFLAFISMQ